MGMVWALKRVSMTFLSLSVRKEAETGKDVDSTGVCGLVLIEG